LKALVPDKEIPMKRVLYASLSLVVCFILAGCAAETDEGLISDTINMMSSATTQISNIKSKVKVATDKAKTENKTTVDLADAVEATKRLKAVSEDAMLLKRKVELKRSSITDEEKKSYAEKQRDQLNAAFTELLKQKVELQKQLVETEKLGANFKAEVDKLRERIREAESPFENIAR
jgi:chromosome segregation ATPase